MYGKVLKPELYVWERQWILRQIIKDNIQKTSRDMMNPGFAHLSQNMNE